MASPPRKVLRARRSAPCAASSTTASSTRDGADDEADPRVIVLKGFRKECSAYYFNRQLSAVLLKCGLRATECEPTSRNCSRVATAAFALAERFDSLMREHAAVGFATEQEVGGTPA